MRRPVWIAIAIVAVLAALVYWFWWRVPAPEAPLPVAAPAPVPAAVVPEPIVEVPALDDSDAYVKTLVGGLGLSGPLLGALQQEQVVRSFVAATVAVAGGHSPRRQLGFLEPEGYYVAAESEGRLTVHPESSRRYDGVAAALLALDVETVARLYEESEPLADDAYRDLGEEGRFRPVLLRAIDELLRAPTADLPVELVDTVASYEYTASELESLSAAQKHLLRMGPENQREIQAWLSSLRSLLLE